MSEEQPFQHIPSMDGSEYSDGEIEEPAPLFNLTVLLHSKPIELPFYDDNATIQDLSDAVAEDLQIPPSHQKFLITPKTGLLKPPFKDPNLRLQILREKKIVLMGATSAEVQELDTDIAARKERLIQRRAALQAGRKVKVWKRRDLKKDTDEGKYTFHAIKPLDYLPNPEKSQWYLERLADDAGIKYAMRKHQFSVGLLTELNPAEHITHESSTLGLNKNRGQEILLRLRTDAYDGYRDYKVIRNVLCHELAHNMWGEHDRNFWDLCHTLEKEVEQNDWRRGGKSVGGKEFYNPGKGSQAMDDKADDDIDVGDLTLGVGSSGVRPLSRREIMARAAEERMKKLDQGKKDAESQG